MFVVIGLGFVIIVLACLLTAGVTIRRNRRSISNKDTVNTELLAHYPAAAKRDYVLKEDLLNKCATRPYIAKSVMATTRIEER